MQENTNVVNQNDVEEIDLKELFLVLLGHWKILLISTMMVGIIALLISKFLITPQYESKSELYVLSKSTSITSLTDLQLGSNLTNDYMVIVKGRPVVDQVISNLNLDMTYSQMLDKITLNNPSNSRILEITVQDSDPKMAKAIADEMATVSAAFISQKMDQDPPNIIQYGYDDGNKVSPSIGKNTIIGALLGFLLAAAFVTVTYLLDDSIVTADDVEKKLGMNMLGSLPFQEDANMDDHGVVHKKGKLKARKSA